MGALASFTVLLLARIPRLFLRQTAVKIGLAYNVVASPGRSEPLKLALLLVKALASSRLIIRASASKPLASTPGGFASPFLEPLLGRVDSKRNY